MDNTNTPNQEPNPRKKLIIWTTSALATIGIIFTGVSEGTKVSEWIDEVVTELFGQHEVPPGDYNLIRHGSATIWKNNQWAYADLHSTDGNSIDGSITDTLGIAFGISGEAPNGHLDLDITNKQGRVIGILTGFLTQEGTCTLYFTPDGGIPVKIQFKVKFEAPRAQ